MSMNKNAPYAQYHAAAQSRATGSGDPLLGPDGLRADIPALLLRLGALRALDDRQVLPELVLILEQLPHARLEVQDRYHALRKLQRAVLQVAEAMTPRRLAPRPGAPTRPASLSLEQRLYAGMATNCGYLLHELDHGQGFFSEEHAHGRAWAIRIAFRFYSRELLCAVKTGRAWPVGAWLALHELFVYLVMRGSVRLHAESPTLEEGEFDPELAYKRLLLIGLVTDLFGCERMNVAVVGQLRAIAAGARLVASDGLVGEFGLILVDVGLDCPPQLRGGSLDDPFRGWVLRVPDEFHGLLLSLDPFRSHRVAGAREPEHPPVPPVSLVAAGPECAPRAARPGGRGSSA